MVIQPNAFLSYTAHTLEDYIFHELSTLVMGSYSHEYASCVIDLGISGEYI